ncbi:MAG: hypothetical protein AAGG56_07325 [Pseudomonadota bacterium]
MGKVASYGQQLDVLMDTVLRLAEKAGLDADELVALAHKIDEEKTQYKASLKTRAAKALDDLKRDDPGGYSALVKELG